MTLGFRTTFACTLLFAGACAGEIPLGHGDSSSAGDDASAGDDTDASDATTADIDPSDASSDATTDASTSTDGPDATTDGAVCEPIDDDPLPGTNVAITVRNDAAVPVIVTAGLGCSAEDGYRVESLVDDSVSNTGTCSGNCADLDVAGDGCKDDCGTEPTSLLLQPGASSDLGPWNARMWRPQPTPAECVAVAGEECFHGIAVTEGEVQVSIWRFFPTRNDCGACTCPKDEPACVLEDFFASSDDMRIATPFLADADSVVIVIDD